MTKPQTSQPIHLGQANIEHLAAIQELFIESIQSVASKDYDHDQIKVWSTIRNQQRWQSLFKDQLVIIAEIDNQIVGFGSLENGQYVDFLYVHKDHQRKGIAQKIYNHLEETARTEGHNSISSDVSKTARPFFEHNGFKVVRENKHMIEGVELNNFHMDKNLSN